MKKFCLFLPALIVILLIYPLGINTNVTSNTWTADEVDPPGPGMFMEDVSEGFVRSTPVRPHQIFYSMMTNLVYVPYIWARTSELPPYNFNKFDDQCPELKSELIIISRAMNILAAILIIFLLYNIILLLCGNLFVASFIALSGALNVNLMFQSSVIFYENWSLLWVFLSVLSFIKLWTDKQRSFVYLLYFVILGLLAVSTHERMGGYFVFTFPAAYCRFWMISREEKRSVGSILGLIAISLMTGLLVFCLANSCFNSGFKPVWEYFSYKYSRSVNFTSERLHSMIGMLYILIRCNLHAFWLIFWNLAGVIPLVALLGVRKIFKAKFWLGITLLLFPIGYQIMSIDLPGWTSGRYILGQTIFTTLFAGFGFLHLIEKTDPRKQKIARTLMILSVSFQLIFAFLVKFADTYYYPRRIIESIAKNNPHKKIGIRGFGSLPREWLNIYGAELVSIPENQKPAAGFDIVISKFSESYDRDNDKASIRKPPGWLIFLVRRQCYLYSQGLETICIYNRKRTKTYDTKKI